VFVALGRVGKATTVFRAVAVATGTVGVLVGCGELTEPPAGAPTSPPPCGVGLGVGVDVGGVVAAGPGPAAVVLVAVAAGLGVLCSATWVIDGTPILSTGCGVGVASFVEASGVALRCAISRARACMASCPMEKGAASTGHGR